MIQYLNSWPSGARLRSVAAGVLLLLGSACSGSDNAGPSDAALPGGTIAGDSTAVPVDSAALSGDSLLTLVPADSAVMLGATAALDTRSSLPGIVFASDNMPNQYFNSVHTGSKEGGAVGPDNVLSLLADAKARKARMVLKFTKGADSYIQNSDGTFSFSKWKALVDRFKLIRLAPYITDGTLLGHFLIDEPHRAAKWGGKIIPQSTVEAMAKYSKQIWPTLNTFVHTQMSWLAGSSVTYYYLDAGWAQYAASKGAVSTWASGEISYARKKGLGLMLGMNVLNGGNGSSGIKGTSSRAYSMSANELRTYGKALLSQSYACGFILWQYNSTYYGRSDMKSAMSDISTLAKNHVKTACRQ